MVCRLKCLGLFHHLQVIAVGMFGTLLRNWTINGRIMSMVLIHGDDVELFWIIVGVVQQLAFGTTAGMVLAHEVQIFPSTTCRFEDEKTAVNKQVFTQRTLDNLQSSLAWARHLPVGGVVCWLMIIRKGLLRLEAICLLKLNFDLQYQNKCLLNHVYKQ
jgi:hypothetical protein